MAVQLKSLKNSPNLNDEKDSKNENVEATSSNDNHLNAPKHGTVIPNRVFVGGIAPHTTELDLVNLFSNYGNVTGTKIISDRAGVSKGYGFVTFETDDEALRLLNDRDNIVLGQRRLNIAPAVKKQVYSRSSYECPSTSPLIPSQARQGGVAYVNGMAFFPTPSTPIQSSPHMEPSPIYQSSGNYGPVTPNSPAASYPYPYTPQGPIYYQTPFQYHIPQYETAYEGGQLILPDGSFVIPQYYLTAQPTQELAYYQPPAVHPQDPAAQPPPLQPVLYSAPRAYESTPVVYSTEPPKYGMENGMCNQNGGVVPIVNKEEGETQGHNNQRRNRESTPANNNNIINKVHKSKDDHPRKKQAHPQQDEGRRHIHQFMNSNPDSTNKNVKHHQEPRRGPPPSTSSYSNPNHVNPNPRHAPVQVPQFPYYPRQVLAPPALAPFYQPQPPQARARPFYRPRYGGGRGGRGGGNNKWLPKDEELCQPLTPPITPRSEVTAGVPGSTTGPEDVVQSMQALAI